MLETKRPGLTVTEEPGGLLQKQLVDYDGTVLMDETVLPHDDLIRFMYRPLKKYSQQLTELENHPLFKESLDVSVRDVQDLISKCFAVANDLQMDFPEAYFLMRIALEDILVEEDDGSASFLLSTGMKMVQAVRSLYLTRVRMRNIMEICFGTTESMTQEKRWTRTATVYPQLYTHAFSVRWKPEGDRWVREYEIHSLLELYFFEVCAALRSEKRIVRCQHCWQYFVPKTKKKTDYCDRIWEDGSTCKKRGPNLKRKDGPNEDIYLLAFKKLRARFYERDYRFYAGLPGMSVPGGSYFDWIDDASAARIEYLEGKITGEEFLQRINPEGEELDLESPCQTPAEDILFTPWEQLVEGNMSFDPKQHFQTMQTLDLSAEDPHWEISTAHMQESSSKHGNESLLEKYQK